MQMSMAFHDRRIRLRSMSESLKRELAWIGDAVLALYAREWILQYPSG